MYYRFIGSTYRTGQGYEGESDSEPHKATGMRLIWGEQ
jgi:hypothetical protein